MIAWRVAIALVIVAALLPEFPRYAAERRLYQVSAVLQAVLLRSRDVPDPGRVVAWAATTALSASGALPGDWRPLNLAGSAWLLAGRAEPALDRYREALALGERPEIVVNLGRAYASLGRGDRATSAFVRAAWVSPGLRSTLPKATQAAVRAEVDALEASLASGRLAAPPPLPP